MKRHLLILTVPFVVFAQTTINGGRVFVGKVDASGAISTLPYRTGTGSPSGRDNCGKGGEAYFQADAAPGQNLWVCTTAGTPGTWSQVGGGMAGNATELQGTSVAPGSASEPGSFYGFMPSSANFQLFTFGSGFATVGTTAEIDAAVVPNLGNANIYSAGAKQSVAPSTTTAGLNVASGALPSIPATGDLATDPSGNLNWYDGAAWRVGAVADATLATGVPLIGNGTNHMTMGTTTGTGNFVLSNAPTIDSPVITSFINAAHDHSNPANGGQLTPAAFVAANLTGMGSRLATGTGIYNSGNCIKADSSGNLVDNGSPCSPVVSVFWQTGAIPNLSGDVTTSSSSVTTIAANAVNSSKMSVVNTRRVCTIVVGADNGPALADADIGPQGNECFIPAASTVVEVAVRADGGTPSVLLRKDHVGTLANIMSSALATGPSGGQACSNTGGTISLDGTTNCSATLTTTALAAGDWIGSASGNSGGTVNRMTSITYTVN